MMLENVPDMALGDEVAIPRAITQRLEKAGYDVQMRLVDGWRLGVPQHRQRLILVALRDGQEFTWPVEQEKITLREAIGDLPPLRRGQGRLEMPAARSFSAFQRRARAGMNGRSVVFDHITRPVRADDREAFRLMNPGMRYGDLPKHLRRYRDDIFDDKYNRLSWDEVSRSITAHIAKDGYWYIHPSEQRTLTVREAARIQTFPDHFRFAGVHCADRLQPAGHASRPRRRVRSL
jgi:DNA (cytosine-5)-methyltransferase 1